MENLKRTILAMLVLVLASLVSACDASRSGQQPEPGANLVGTKWMLDSLNGNSPIADTEITLTFEDTHLSGTMTCNGYGGGRDSGKYTATGDGTLAILQLAMTVQLCSSPESVMEQEKAYVEALTKAATYRVIGDHQLQIADDSGNVMLGYTRIEYGSSE
jgi:heat shock protein HslJ